MQILSDQITVGQIYGRFFNFKINEKCPMSSLV